MKKSKILLFSRDPGAANCIMPVYQRLLENARHTVELVGKDFALAKYREQGLPVIDISELVSDLSYGSIKKLLSGGAYSAVVTGVGSDDLTDRLLWQAAKELSIPSLAIIDQWLNYSVRFTFVKPGLDVANAPRIYPDTICTIDEHAKNEMIGEGIPEEKIIITGQPYFETVIARQKKITNKHIKSIRTSLGVPKVGTLITYASEPIVESYEDPFYWGYTEFSILDHVLTAIAKASKGETETVLVVRLHPRNNPELFRDFWAQRVPTPRIRVLFEHSLSSQELIAASDLIVGMSSMFLIEAALAGKPYASVQIGLTRQDPFILSRQGISKNILSDKDLVLLFENSLRGKGTFHVHFPVIQNASKRICAVIESRINEKTSN